MQSVGSLARSGSATDELRRIKTFSTSEFSASAVEPGLSFLESTAGVFDDAECCSSCAVFFGSMIDETLCFAAATPKKGRPRSTHTRNFTNAKREKMAHWRVSEPFAMFSLTAASRLNCVGNPETCCQRAHAMRWLRACWPKWVVHMRLTSTEQPRSILTACLPPASSATDIGAARCRWRGGGDEPPAV